MILDYSRADENGKMGRLEQKYALGVVLVDGKEIKLVRYADTQAGFVVTFDVVLDGMIVPARNYTAADFPGREVDCPWDGVLAETIRGKVELFTREEWNACGTHPG